MADPGDWVLATISAWLGEQPKRNVKRLIVDYIDFNEMYDALCTLHGRAGLKEPTKHRDMGDPDIPKEKTALALVELLEKFHNGEFGGVPNFVCHSKDIHRIPMASFAKNDTVSLGTRMTDLEKIITELMKKIDKFEGVSAIACQHWSAQLCNMTPALPPTDSAQKSGVERA